MILKSLVGLAALAGVLLSCGTVSQANDDIPDYNNQVDVLVANAPASCEWKAEPKEEETDWYFYCGDVWLTHEIEYHPVPELEKPVALVSYPTDIWSRVVYWFEGNAWYVYHVIMKCETGGTYSPTSVGSALERGLMQIHPTHNYDWRGRYGYGTIQQLGYTWDDMFLVEPNLHVAYQIYVNAGYSFVPWSCR